MRVIRPQNLPDCVRKLVREVLGPEFAAERAPSATAASGPASGIMAELTQVYSEIDARDPVLLLVKPGADPTTSLREFAEEVHGKAPQEAGRVGLFSGISLRTGASLEISPISITFIGGIPRKRAANVVSGIS